MADSLWKRVKPQVANEGAAPGAASPSSAADDIAPDSDIADETTPKPAKSKFASIQALKDYAAK